VKSLKVKVEGSSVSSFYGADILPIEGKGDVTFEEDGRLTVKVPGHYDMGRAARVEPCEVVYPKGGWSKATFLNV
jgi:hypothetical protein